MEVVLEAGDAIENGNPVLTAKIAKLGRSNAHTPAFRGIDVDVVRVVLAGTGAGAGDRAKLPGSRFGPSGSSRGAGLEILRGDGTRGAPCAGGHQGHNEALKLINPILQCRGARAVGSRRWFGE